MAHLIVNEVWLGDKLISTDEHDYIILDDIGYVTDLRLEDIENGNDLMRYMQIKGGVFNWPLKKLRLANNMLYECGITHFGAEMPIVEELGAMLMNNPLEEFTSLISRSPRSANHFLRSNNTAGIKSKLAYFSQYMRSIKEANYMFAANNQLSVIIFQKMDTTGLNLLEEADYMFQGCKMETVYGVTFPKLRTGINMFLNNNLPDTEINAILASLPTWDYGTHIITFTGCPGAATCDPTLAEPRGWRVDR